MTFVSYAQNFEDVLLWRALGHLPAGFYIDVGASHPDTDSVTRAFYDRGWHGINVEPTEGAYRRLVAARPRDVNLRLALGTSAGTANFFSVDDVNAGLSTLSVDAVARYGALGMAVRQMTVSTDTLAAVCRANAPRDIHFLKVDVEGAERSVLEGADFDRFRPWIVLAEATAPMSTVETHAEWEPLLLDADYRFVWFDGLNRFYVAAERHAELARHFRTPPNVFDDFLRAADTEWARRVNRAEAEAEAVKDRAAQAEFRAAIAEDRAEAATLRLLRSGTEATRLQKLVDTHSSTISGLERKCSHALERADAAEQQRAEAAAWLDAMRRSTSWRVTGPLRRAMGARNRAVVQAGAELPAAVPAASAPTFATTLPVLRRTMRRRAVHQFHSGTAYGDAITNSMLLTQRVLCGLGYDSRIFAEHRDPALGDAIHGLDALPEHDDYVLLVRHSMGHDAFDRILRLPAPKVLMYHNITPPELLEHAPFMQRYARLGREQLASLRPAVAAALADSTFNAIELLKLGFEEVSACPMLFDLDAMLAQATPHQHSAVFTILFVGRIAESKGQMELVAAYARFRSLYAGASRLVLVGRHDGGGDYLAGLLALIRRHGLDTGAVEITGLVQDADLRRHYAQADLYVSLSQHEGFGVPLAEAAAHGVPVLALDAGAVPYTLGVGSADLLQDATPTAVAARMCALAMDPARRAALAAVQLASVRRFALPLQVPMLVEALVRAGAERPVDRVMHAALAANTRLTIAGHVNGSYSLAEINRQFALTLDAARPGAVRLLPVESEVTSDVAGVPVAQRATIGALLARPSPMTGPLVVISQHYPVWVPHDPGDVAMALFFWEESLVPAATVAVLNAGFQGILAPTTSVAKALLDSGVRVPVRVIGQAPQLQAFRQLRAERGTVQRGPAFTFLHVSSCFPRKGVDVLLRAYARAFRSSDNVRLVIKGFPNPHNTVSADLARLQASDPGMAPVELIDRDLTGEDLMALFRDADAVVLPTRGEGFNLPAAEAIAAGIPLIVTGWGGHMDFVQHAPAGSVRLLDYRFGPSGSHLATPFSLWAEPSEDDLVAALLEAVAQRNRGTEPVELPVDDIAERVTAFAADLLLAPPLLPLTTGWITTWDVRCGIAEYSRRLVGVIAAPAIVLADLRTPLPPEQPAGASGRIKVEPVWRLADPGSLPRLTDAILRHDPRAVVLQHQPGLVPWAMLPGLLLHPALWGRVVCVTLHNTQDLVDAPAGVRAAVVAALRRMSRVVVHTVRDMNTLAALSLVDNTMLIPHGADPPHDIAAVRMLDPGLPVRVGSYGFFLPGKGIPQLIEALAILRRTWPQARLHLVNAEYPVPESAAEITASQALVARLDLVDAVAFETAFLDDAASVQLLRACDVVALPYQSSKEGSSAALRSALSAGVPVAVTRLPLFDEAAGAVIPLPGTAPAEIATGLDRALRDQLARQAAVAAGRAWSEERDWVRTGRHWQAMLEALAASGVVVEQP